MLKLKLANWLFPLCRKQMKCNSCSLVLIGSNMVRKVTSLDVETIQLVLWKKYEITRAGMSTLGGVDHLPRYKFTTRYLKANYRI